METLKVHPAAECVRLMDEEELASLAASIQAHGQRDPIILGRVNGAASEALIDGRNRLKACEIAGVEPRFETIEFEDDEAVKAFIADKSEHRNLTKGQQAMRLALLYPEPKRGKHSELRNSTGKMGFDKARLSQARAVYAYSPELALAVRDGTKKLDEALKEVKTAREELNSQEWKLAKLRNDAPDLADLVDEDRMALGEAIAAFNQREAEQKAIEDNKRETLIRLTEAACRGLEAWTNEGFAQDVEERLQDHEFMKQLSERAKMLPASTIKQAAVNLMRLYAREEIERDRNDRQ
jgi:ParB-like chromosome segregation protein Spo0J